MIIDLVVLLTFALPLFFTFDATAFRLLRLLRIMRIARLGRFSRALHSLSSVLKKNAPELIVSVAFSFVLLIIASTGIYHFEKDAQPELFGSIPQSVWWAINVLTGIWLGDVYPITLWGKTFAGLVSLLGVGTIALPAGIIASGIFESIDGKEEKNPVRCKHCDQVLDLKDVS